ncbi:uncharacterized protein [Dendrobates tinctorius]|uniref:uncharacterized protein isoform X4 n=1 Tax=Dendrobates tinctorius TaxID=92724 RepID=UPI003CCA5D39
MHRLRAQSRAPCGGCVTKNLRRWKSAETAVDEKTHGVWTRWQRKERELLQRQRHLSGSTNTLKLDCKRTLSLHCCLRKSASYIRLRHNGDYSGLLAGCQEVEAREAAGRRGTDRARILAGTSRRDHLTFEVTLRGLYGRKYPKLTPF